MLDIIKLRKQPVVRLASSRFFSLYDGHLLPTKVEDMIEDHKYLHQQYAIEACLSFLARVFSSLSQIFFHGSEEFAAGKKGTVLEALTDHVKMRICNSIGRRLQLLQLSLRTRINLVRTRKHKT